MSDSSYSNRLRVRSCGLLVEDDKLLLVELLSPVTKDWTWIPPGGGVEFGESLHEALVREFREETGLTVTVGKQVYLNEVIQENIHAVELYFLVTRVEGELELGTDPEMDEHNQILRDLRFFSQSEIQELSIAPDFIGSKLWENI